MTRNLKFRYWQIRKKKTLTFIDNGIGMTEDEVDEYINQIAFSGAEAFLEQYKDKASEDQIIGHFGLGFYSAFMVANTRSSGHTKTEPKLFFGIVKTERNFP